MKLPAIRQLPSGNWFCQLRLDGHSVSITEPTYDRCKARALAYKTGVLAVRRDPLTLTLGAACDAYIDARRGVCSPSTIDGYEKDRRNYFQGLMGMRLSQITAKSLSLAARRERQRISRRGKPLSAKTVQTALGFIVCVLNENGAHLDGVDWPEVPEKLIRLPAPETIIRAVQGTSIELPCLLAAWLSLSMSEIRGLTKSRSLVGDQLYIMDTAVRVRKSTKKDAGGKTRGVYGDILKEGGKEELRTRVFDLPPYLRRLIDQVDGDVIVPLTVRQIEGRFQRLLEKEHIQIITFHQLRHLSASTMAMLKVQKEVAQQRGGWKTPHTMNRVYTHVFDDARQAADQKIDAYFSAILSPPAEQNANKKLTPEQKRKVYRYFRR